MQKTCCCSYSLSFSALSEMMPMAVTPLTNSLFGAAVDVSIQAGIHASGLLNEVNLVRRFIPSFSNHLFINLHVSCEKSDSFVLKRTEFFKNDKQSTVIGNCSSNFLLTSKPSSWCCHHREAPSHDRVPVSL